MPLSLSFSLQDKIAKKAAAKPKVKKSASKWDVSPQARRVCAAQDG